MSACLNIRIESLPGSACSSSPEPTDLSTIARRSLVAAGCDRLKVGEGELPPEHRADLQQRLGLGHLVEAGRQQGVEAGRHLAQFAGAIGLEHRQRQFLEIERHALGARRDAGLDLLASAGCRRSTGSVAGCRRRSDARDEGRSCNRQRASAARTRPGWSPGSLPATSSMLPSTSISRFSIVGSIHCTSSTIASTRPNFVRFMNCVDSSVTSRSRICFGAASGSR